MKRTLLNLIIFLISIWSFGQSCGALMVPMSIEDRVNESTKIVEGVITNSHSLWDANKHNIYTVHTLSVYTDMLGGSTSTIYFVTMGGQVDDTMQVISDAASLEPGITGTFFLKESSVNIVHKFTLYELVGAAQGAIKYDKYSENASDVFSKYTSISKDLYPKIQRVAAKTFRTLQVMPVSSKLSNIKSATPVISSFSPTTASAGTKTVLTINGSNFGTNMGTVSFRDANSGGSSYYSTLDSQIISWSDSQIQVEVPWRAGTGTIRVTNSSAQSGTSTAALTIPYSLVNASTGTADFRATLPDDNGNGGFTFLYHTEFDNSAAKTYFEEAFALWNCESDINFVFGGTTTIDASIDDDMNVVRFDNGNELPSSTLGRVTTTYIRACGTKAIVKQMDITWNDGANWYYGSGTPSSSQHDFKTVALHELGHAHQLGHVINSSVAMHYGISVGQTKYFLDQNDIDGAVYTMGLFRENPGCGAAAMSPQINCCDAITISTNPSNQSVAENGTATFTVAATNNTTVQWQVSTNNGTSWSDVSNNATYSGATSTMLTINNASLSLNGYQYRAYLNNPCDDGVLSNTGTLNVIEYTSIPDSNFEAALSTYDDIANDGQVPTNNINTLTSLDVNDSNISNLTGIADFTALESLSLSGNSVTSLDLTGISKLTVLAARNNGLTALDISTHPNMDVLLLENNSLTSLDVSNNVNLTRIWAQNNNINAIDVSKNILLRALGISDSNLTSLDLTKNIALEQLYVRGNSITDLDLSQNSVLRIISVNNNNLSSLNVKNGNNTNVTTFAASGNPNLTCILVDDANYSSTNWTSIDAQTNFNDVICTTEYTAIPDSNFEAALSTYDNIPNDGQVPTDLIKTITDLNVSNQNISDLTGIEDFTALEQLIVGNNNLNSLDLSNNNALTFIAAGQNNLTTINFGTNTSYEAIALFENNLSSLDITNFNQLDLLNIKNNPIQSLDLSTVTSLRNFRCSDCNLTSLNLKNGNNTNISILDITGNSALTCVLVDDANYSTTNWTNIDSQTSFSDTLCSPYTAIPDPNFEAALGNLVFDDVAGDGQIPTASIVSLTSLNVSSKSITDLTGIETFVSLTELVMTQNPITTLDLTNNRQLQTLNAFGCDLTTIHLTGLTQLTTLNLISNELTSIDLSAFPNLNVVRLRSNNLTEVNLRNGANANISSADFRSNDDLTCVFINDLSHVTNTWFKDSHTNYRVTDYCEYTTIPDINFETALGALGLDDVSGDQQVPTDAIKDILSLDVSSKNIADITGIEDFVSLTSLNASTNPFTSININTLTQLVELSLENTNITSLDLSSNSVLALLALEESSLTSLDVSSNLQLEVLTVPDNASLTDITFGNNNQLKSLVANDCALTSLDLSALTALEDVRLGSNDLTSLHLKNGNNTSITSFDARGNTSLSCISVDDEAYSTTNWTNIDVQTSFSVDCEAPVISNCTALTVSNSSGLCGATVAVPQPEVSDNLTPSAAVSPITSYRYNNRFKFLIDTPTVVSNAVVLNNDVTIEITIKGDHSSNVEEFHLTGPDGSTVYRSGNLGSCVERIRTVTVSQSTWNNWVTTYGSDLTFTLMSNNVVSQRSCSNAYFRIKATSTGGIITLTNDYNDSEDASDFYPLGTTEVTWTATDLAGNTATCTQSITVNDTEVPTVICNDITVQLDAMGTATITAADINDGSTDNCGIDTIEININTFDCSNLGNNTVTLLVTDVHGNSSSCDAIVTVEDPIGNCGIRIRPKVYLQGAAINPNTGEESLMRDDLRVADLVPITSPYADSQILTASVLDATGDNAIVDWVWIELRDPNDASVVIAGQSALLQRDGDIVAIDGVSDLRFLVDPDNYYVLVTHRNHLGVLSANTVALSGIVTSLDFSNDTSLIQGGTNAVVDLGSGRYAMLAGDQDRNGQVQNTDINSVITILGGSDYNNADMDMNGQIQNTDINNLMNPNVGKGEQF